MKTKLMIVYLVPDFMILNQVLKRTSLNFKPRCNKLVLNVLIVHLYRLACRPRRTGSVLHLLVCLCIACTEKILYNPFSDFLFQGSDSTMIFFFLNTEMSPSVWMIYHGD